MTLGERAFTLEMAVRDKDGNVIASTRQVFPYAGAQWTLRPFREGVRAFFQRTGYDLGTDLLRAVNALDPAVDNAPLKVERAA